jgi:hypothetical protein
MEENEMNKVVAKELSEALARCQQQGIDAGTVRTGLLTITIANFINGIGMENTSNLFNVLPEQIHSGIFDRFVTPDQNHNPPQPAERIAAPNPPPPFKPYNAQYLPPSAINNSGQYGSSAGLPGIQQPATPKRRRL